MERLDYWEDALSTYLDRVRDYSFSWGCVGKETHDCAHFAFEAVKIQTGVDLMDDFKGQYDSLRTAYKWLKDRGYKSFADAVTHKLGQPVSCTLGRRGDIISRKINGKTLLGVCVGRFSYHIGENGLEPWPTIQCDKVWRIG